MSDIDQKYIIILGNGAREAAILKSLRKEQVNRYFGYNIYLSYHADKKNPAIPCKYIDRLTLEDIIYRDAKSIEYIVVGQEKYFNDKLLLDCFAANIPVVGPHPTVAKLETSKKFARNIVENVDDSFNPKYDFSLNDIHKDMSFVIKPDGLTGGKGVKIYPDDFDCFESAIAYINHLGGISKCLIEERLVGDEFSMMCFVDNKLTHFMPIVQDFKRALNNDKGLNTGSMGSICNNRNGSYSNKNYAMNDTGLYFLHDEYSKCTKFINSIIKYLSEHVGKYNGILYGSFMKTQNNELKLIEFNCRFGDPEAINILDLMLTPLHHVFTAIIKNKLSLRVINYEYKINYLVYVVPEHYGTGESSKSHTSPGQTFKFNDILTYDIDDREPTPQSAFTGHMHFDNKKVYKPYEIFPASVYRLTYCNHPDVPVPNNGHPTGVTIYPTDSRFYCVLVNGDTFDECKTKLDAYFQSNPVSTGLRRRTDILDTYLDKKNRYYYTSIGGVDTNLVNDTLQEVKNDIESTHTQNNQENKYGSFGGHFKLNNNIELVASTDGVGTKILLLDAIYGEKGYYIAGQDLVHHNINDILVDCATPLFFLDYFGCNKFKPSDFKQFIKGCTDACNKYNIALIGGETAIMKDIYKSDTADLTGTIVGQKTFNYNNNITNGILVGIPSSGFHTNGFSLLRHFCSSCDDNSFMDSILPGIEEPHRCYLDLISTLMLDDKTTINGLIHITGGGYHDNIKRIIKSSYELDIDAIEFPKYYDEILKRMTKEECVNTFNCGYGLIIITDGLDETNFENIKKLEPNAKIIGKIQ